ncbi:MAG: hypothetical protein WBB42_00285, partial [Polyangiales bacterium]
MQGGRFVYIAEIDRRKLYLEHAFPSMFAFCTPRFHMSEAIAAKRIRAGRVAGRFPRVFGMIARGELHLSGVHLLARQLTEENHEEVLRRAKHRSMREIEKLIAEIAPKPDAPASIRALPEKPRAARKRGKSETRAIPAGVRREVFTRDAGRCAFVDAEGRRCSSAWQVEFHHLVPYARGGPHGVENIELRCRANNQYEAELEYGAGFMASRRSRGSGTGSV